MKVELVDSMGDDLMVVNAARVSYAKSRAEFQIDDARLLHYLATHGHWSPFAHPQLSFRISSSIAVARQLYRHQVGLAVNETSRRYVDSQPEFDLPEVWRGRAKKGQSKQGSDSALSDAAQAEVIELALIATATCEDAYKSLLAMGVAPEQARLVLPMSMITEWIWTGSLMAFIRICRERRAKNAQAETREVADEIYRHLLSLFPHSMAAWQAS